jgi:hypothetical protein
MKGIEIQKYETTLFEIDKRLGVIRAYLGKEKTTGYLIIEVELIAVQFRKIIELIAFSSLIVNKDEYDAFRAGMNKDFSKDWNAKRIFDSLAKINPHFYPQPSKQFVRKDESGKQIVELQNITSGYLTKEDAIEVYNICSSVLHEWNPYTEKKDINMIYDKFTDWGNKLVTLLSHHTIMLGPKRLMVAAEMQSRLTGKPKAFLFSQMSNDEISKLPSKMKFDLKKLGL